MNALASRRPGRLRPDPARVVAELFVPGHALAGEHEDRAPGVIDHVLGLSDEEVTEALASVVQRFEGRHRDLTEIFSHHADRIGNRLDSTADLSEERWLLLGATFTMEFAVEGAAVCNPSAVAAPDQAGAPDGSLRFVMSVRQIGEGHRSSVGFRSGLLDADGDISLDEPGPFTAAPTVGRSVLGQDALRGLAGPAQSDAEATTWVLDRLGDEFTVEELDGLLTELLTQRDTRRNVPEAVAGLRRLAARTYTARFPASSTLSERVLLPVTAAESNGIEDARFVRFVDDDGSVAYHATCTGFDGRAIVQQLLTTVDFVTFTSSPLHGAAAANKGLALFPRRIAGRFVALSRFDGASNAISFSHDLRQWPTAERLVCPPAAWEAVQVGNCGPPIETDDGWLALTHGVGPFRTYSIGAWLLDLDDPSRVIGRLQEPLLTPRASEQDGYVPNVVYSCGGLLHGGTLLLPYGIGDSSIGFATVALADLLAALHEGAGAGVTRSG